MDKKMLREFQKPSSCYRGAPFWAWNGKLEPEELRRQIRLMREMGLGGFFMHSRVGLDTPYLSDEWFECIEACVDEAEKLDMQAWLYDEDRWPSGAAGGLVTKNPEFRRRALVMEKADSTEKINFENSIGTFVALMKGNKLISYRKISAPEKTEKTETILNFHVKTATPDSWYNGQTYLDTLNHEAVKKFIEVTHEKYRKKDGKHFGGRIPGIFTDEPNSRSDYAQLENTTSIGWTEKLPEYFKERYGYDILEILPELYYTMEKYDFSKPRYHYFDCVCFLFTDAFSKQIGEWCEKNNMLHTGHALHEDTLSSQTTMGGGASMRFYEFMQAPGMDLLTEYRKIYNTAKQVSSAANQFGRKWRLTETYGCSGWDFSFEGHKALGDWQAALGINLRCQHLAWYTMEGEAKRDYPASIFYQSPWWDAYSKVEDYFGRIHAVMTKGKEVKDILVIHPVESMWGIIGPGFNKDLNVRKLDRSFFEISDFLLRGNLDFDFGDEDIIARHAKVENGVFTIAKASYSKILVPESITIRSSTLELLRKFKKQGGEVVFAGKIPSYLDGEPSKAPENFAGKCIAVPLKEKEVIKVMENNRRVSISDKEGKQLEETLYLLKEDEDSFYIFVCNVGHPEKTAPLEIDPLKTKERTKEYSQAVITMNLNAGGQVIELDPDTGNIRGTDCTLKKGMIQIRTSFPKLGSRLFVINKKAGGEKISAPKKLRSLRKRKLGSKNIPVSLSENNVLVLDKPKYKIDSGKWKTEDDILKVDFKVRDALKTEHRGGRMVQPWAREKNNNPASVKLNLLYKFQVKEIPSGDLSLAVEQPETFSLKINGTPISTDMDCGWWCDKSLRKIPVDPALLTKGENSLEMKCVYTERHPGLEIVYLLGNFGVKTSSGSFVIIEPVKKLDMGNWVKQGLPFYSGNVSYIYKTLKPDNGKVFLKIPSYKGTAVRIIINGKPVGTAAWAPNEIEITGHLKEGSNTLAIELLGSRRNSHGPLHWKAKEKHWTGPACFTTEGKWWSKTYDLVPSGIMEPPSIEIKK